MERHAELKRWVLTQRPIASDRPKDWSGSQKKKLTGSCPLTIGILEKRIHRRQPSPLTSGIHENRLRRTARRTAVARRRDVEGSCPVTNGILQNRKAPTCAQLRRNCKANNQMTSRSSCRRTGEAHKTKLSAGEAQSTNLAKPFLVSVGVHTSQGSRAAVRLTTSR